jgi:hypothetical protein
MSSNEVPYSTQMSGISVIYLTGLDKRILNKITMPRQIDVSKLFAEK